MILDHMRTIFRGGGVNLYTEQLIREYILYWCSETENQCYTKLCAVFSSSCPVFAP